MSDTLCRLATGSGFAVRQLYTDQDEVLFDADPPPLEWSILKYGFQAEGGSRCARSDIHPKRSWPSYARSMFWLRKEPRWRTRSARLGSRRSASGRVAGWGDLLQLTG